MDFHDTIDERKTNLNTHLGHYHFNASHSGKIGSVMGGHGNGTNSAAATLSMERIVKINQHDDLVDRMMNNSHDVATHDRVIMGKAAPAILDTDDDNDDMVARMIDGGMGVVPRPSFN